MRAIGLVELRTSGIEDMWNWGQVELRTSGIEDKWNCRALYMETALYYHHQCIYVYSTVVYFLSKDSYSYMTWSDYSCHKHRKSDQLQPSRKLSFPSCLVPSRESCLSQVAIFCHAQLSWKFDLILVLLNQML